ncbi:MAG TPA: PAS domain-containing protein, partial [Acidimicrobiales bacterium]|nr:PAS domain-containing protein [Acidimicrobiales bacterium]
ILSHLHFALRDSGCLFLGKAEMLLTHTRLFRPFDLKNRVFSKVPAPRDPREQERPQEAVPAAAPEAATHEDIRDLAFDSVPLAQVAIDPQGVLTAANRTAQSMFGLRPADVGRTLQDLPLSYRPTNLRSLIEQAYAERAPVTRDGVEHVPADGGTQFLDIAVLPLVGADGSVVGASVTFDDVTRSRRLEDDLKRSKEELETAYEELQSTNEELETTNEELQSTVEELETTNEELQSTNEELETMNEELQSTNTELQTINDELNQRSVDLDRANAFLESVLASQKSAVVVVDRNFMVVEWNVRAEDLWGVGAQEARGTSLLKLDIGLPVAELAETLRACLVDQASPPQVTLSATNRRGKAIECVVVCTPLVGPHGSREGVVVAIETTGVTEAS